MNQLESLSPISKKLHKAYTANQLPFPSYCLPEKTANRQKLTAKS
jgi:hypothetical protein